VGATKLVLQLWELYSTSVPARQNAAEQQEFKLNFYIFIQLATAKRDATQCPTIAKPCSLCAIIHFNENLEKYTP
jgi:hypothetical protein